MKINVSSPNMKSMELDGKAVVGERSRRKEKDGRRKKVRQMSSLKFTRVGCSPGGIMVK